MQNLLYRVIRIATENMGSISPYFSPKKTRNFSKQHDGSLLQKLTRSSKSSEPKNNDTEATHLAKARETRSSKITTDISSRETIKGRKRNIRSDAVVSRAVATVVPTTNSTEIEKKTSTKPDLPGKNTSIVRDVEHKTLDVIKYACGSDQLKAEVYIKVEPADEYKNWNEKTPCKQEPVDEPSPLKRDVKDVSLDRDASKEIKWEPENWRQTMENIRAMRRTYVAPVDTMGCDQFTINSKNIIPDRLKRYHCLVSLMLSSQTKDQANHECMSRLKEHRLTPESIVATDVAVLEKIIYPVSFYKNKSKFIKNMSQILIDHYDGDIPNNIEGLLKLPGVGKKMAHLCMRSAWNIITGIGVDTHVHRISNWLQWVPKETKTPEDTRVALEKWLPFELWEEVNHMMVGFGQTICTSTFPRCNDCLNAPICPARGKHGIRKTPIKKEIKCEDLEF